MADQKVSLKIGADTTELERAFSSLIKKIQSDADKLKLSPASSRAAPGVSTIQEASQTSRALDQKIRQEKFGIEQVTRELVKKEAQLARMVKLEKEGLDVANKRLRLERELQETQNKQQILQTRLNESQRAFDRARGVGPPSGGGGGRGIGAGGITSLGGFAQFAGAPLSAVGGIATALSAIRAMESGRRFVSEAPLRAREVEASAFNMQGQGGQRLQSFLNGGAAEELGFNSQRVQAAEYARSAIQGRYETHNTPIGWAAFAIRNPMQALRQAGGALGSSGLQKEFEETRAREQAGLQGSQFEALKTGPEGAIRSAVFNKYLQNYQRDLDFQRQMGLNNESFRGGFKSNIFNAGFDDTQGMGMAGSIMGAGGSTRSSVGNAALGLQAQRNLDITNAGSVLGKLSASLGSAETTKEAFVKLLAEGTKIGLDGSDFREENRKFVETAAQMISQSGTTTAGGAEQLLNQFGRFFGDKTGVGIDAGKGAFELYRQTSMATTGPRATMRAAGMLTDPIISKLSRDSREALFNMPIDQLTSDNPAIAAMAKQANTTPQQLIDAQNRVTSNSANLFKSSDIATKNLANIKNKYSMGSAIGYQGPFSPAVYEEVNDALGLSNIAQIKENPILGQSQRSASAYSDALSAGDVQRQGLALEEARKQQQLASPTSGRPEDETNRIQAEASRLANQLFMSIKDSIVPASDAAKSFANDINALTAAMKGSNPSQAARLFTDFQNKYGTGPVSQPSAGSPSSGGGSGR